MSGRIKYSVKKRTLSAHEFGGLKPILHPLIFFWPLAERQMAAEFC